MSEGVQTVIESIARAETRVQPWRVVAGRFSSVVVIGLLTGAVVGGLGGRIAMLVLRLTSDPSLRGLETDDGFTIGVVSGATMFLLTATAILGILGAVAYVVFRLWLPPRLRSWTAGIVAGVVGGAVVIRPGGIDFTRLEPLGLAVAMFIALPAAYGFVLAVLVERSFRRPAGTRWISLIPLPLLLPFPILFGVRNPLVLTSALAVGVVIWLLARDRGVVATWSSPVVAWPGRIALAAVTSFASVELVRDVIEVL